MNKPKIHYRELSIADWRYLNNIVEKYLRRRFLTYRISRSDFDDTLVEASDLAYESICCYSKDIHDLKVFMHRIAYTSINYTLRKRGYRRNLVWIDAIPISTPNVNTDNLDDEPEDSGFFLSDEGAGAEKIRDSVTERLDMGYEPEWLRLFRKARKAQKGKARKILSALEKTTIYAEAMKECGIPEPTFYRILIKIRRDFAQCFRAYHEWLIKK